MLTKLMGWTLIGSIALLLSWTGLESLMGVSCSGLSNAETPDVASETAIEDDARMHWWREARFGMFIHWGVYSALEGEYRGQRSERIGEWIKAWLDIPNDEYDQFVPKFNPTKFDASFWVSCAKKAGMKYIVITSKHHEGFCLFDSKATDYDIVDATPYGRDLLAPLAKECHRQDIKLGIYYSILDWHHPAQVESSSSDSDDWAWARGWNQTALREGEPSAKEEYVAYMKTQLRELITSYDPAVLWFDGEWVNWWTESDGRELYSYLRSLKPELIINNRVGKSRNGMAGLNNDAQEVIGDFGTPEQQIPSKGLPGVDWETCMTMNDTWGYKSYDDNWKSAKTLIRNLIDVASKGGNYLLNIGPKSDGTIPTESVQLLHEIGQWMDLNGESIYGTSASPFEKLPWGRCTKKGDKLYLHVFEMPDDSIVKLPARDVRGRSASLLAVPGSDLPVATKNGSIAIDLSGAGKVPHADVATVIVLETD